MIKLSSFIFSGCKIRAIAYGVLLCVGVTLAQQRLFGQDCPQAFMQSKSGSTNRIRAGHVGFVNQTNSNGTLAIYLQYQKQTDDVLDGYNCSDMEGVGYDNHFTYLQQWSVKYNPTNVTAGNDWFPCGTVRPDVDDKDGTVHYEHGGNFCDREMVNWQWTTTNPCPGAGWSDYTYGGLQSGVVVETWQQDRHYYSMTITNAGGCVDRSGESEILEELSSPYTVDMLISSLKEDVTDQLTAADWGGSRTATFSLSGLGTCGSYSAFKFKYSHRAGCGVTYNVVLKRSYSISYRNGSAGASTNYTVYETNSFIGDNRSHTSPEILVEPPAGQDILLSSVTVELVAPGRSPCRSSCGIGATTLGFCSSSSSGGGGGSTFFLGGEGDDSGGFLSVEGPSSGSSTVTAADLDFSSVNLEAAEIIGEPPTQIKVPSGLVTITETNGTVILSFYSSAGSRDPVTGLYAVISGSFVSSYTLSAATSGSGASTVSRFRVTPSVGGYNELISSNNWFFVDRGDGNWFEGMLVGTNSAGTVLTNVHQILDNAGNPISVETIAYAQNEMTHANLRWLQILGSGVDALTNVWIYALDVPTNDINYGKLVWTINGYGGWSRNVWDTNGILTKTVTGFGNAATNASESECRVFEYVYTPLNSDDTGGLEAGTPRVVYEKVQGTIVGMRGKLLLPNERYDVIFGGENFGNPDEWYDAKNLLRYTREIQLENGTGTAVFSPGGVLVNGAYSFTNAAGTHLTNVVIRNASGTGLNLEEITNGTRTVSISTLSDGHVQSIKTYDGATGILTDQQTYSYFGAGNHSYTITFLDGSTETHNQSDCCGVTSLIERSGVTNEYVYDAQKRLVLTKRLGIVTSNVLDNAGRTIESWRIGTDGSAIRLKAMTYDTLGRVRFSTDGLGYITTNVYTLAADGRFIKEARHAVGSNRKEYQNRDGTLERMTGSAVHPKRYTNWAADNTFFSRWIALETNETDTLEFVTSVMDFAKRTAATVYPDGVIATNIYTADRLVIARDPDNVSTLYGYNSVGELEYTALDMNGGEVVDLAGTDRITRTIRFDANNAHGNVHSKVTFAWTTAESDSPVETLRTEASMDGLRTWQVSFGRTNLSATVLLPNGLRVTTNTAPDGSYSVATNQYGRETSVTQYGRTGTQVGQVIFGYDAHGRVRFITDARNGTTTNTYDALDRIVSVAMPSPLPGNSSQVISNLYDSAGRLWKTIQPDGTSVTNQYSSSGELSVRSGSRAYPIQQSYDSQGRMTGLRTWRDFAGSSGAADIAWSYNARGQLERKSYADGSSVSNVYYPSGRLYRRTWARGIDTGYSYSSGDLIGISPNDGTTVGESFSYDRRGRMTGRSRGGVASLTFTYNDAGSLTSETQNGVVVTNRYDEFQRRTNVAVVIDGITVSSAGYSYDDAGRLLSVTDGTSSATYGYVANSRLVAQISFRQNGTTRMTTTKSYNSLNRLLAITNAPSTDIPLLFNYSYNPANQRTAVTNADSSHWAYAYDFLGQVTNANKFWSDSSRVLGQQFGYAFDDIGNRKTAFSGGDASGRDARRQVYSANNLNQYTSRTVPGYIDVIGAATNVATVSVNNASASRKGEYYRGEVSVLNSGAAVWQPITNVAVLAFGSNDIVTNWTGNLFVPSTPEGFGYDLDGNMTNDGRWTFTWDAENRLTRMQSISGAPIGASNRLTFVYDAMGRRISKVTETFVSGAWNITLSNRFIYDGWNLLAELNSTNNAVINSFMWGLDLSGTTQGAGGVGGLLALTATNAGTHFVSYDGDANVVALVSANTGTRTANYEYDPFGNILRITGAMALQNPFRFSTKYTDVESGFSYYGYRFYNPVLGRWVNRDPLGEKGGESLYAFVHNTLVPDYLGLIEVTQTPTGFDVSFDDFEASVGPEGGEASHELAGTDTTKVLGGVAGAYSYSVKQSVSIRVLAVRQQDCQRTSTEPTSSDYDLSITWWPLPPTPKFTATEKAGDFMEASVSASMQSYVLYVVYSAASSAKFKDRAWLGGRCLCLEATSTTTFNAEFTVNTFGVIGLVLVPFGLGAEVSAMSLGGLILRPAMAF
jgi:RHS repeat-associated protein